MPQKFTRNNIIGIDFSGSLDAGRKIWVSEAAVAGTLLEIATCERLEHFLNVDRKRDICLPLLREYLAEKKDAIIGIDFPFGIPKKLFDQKTWIDFILEFPPNFSSPEAFRDYCFKRSGGIEIKRKTGIEAQVPFSSYNLWIYKQTYFGITSVLYPLLKKDAIRVLPMQEINDSLPWVLEICPASVLKRENLYLSYKGKTKLHRDNRKKIAETIQRKHSVSFSNNLTFTKLVDDPEGDALDSVLSVLAVYNNLNKDIEYHQDYKKEGHVFC